MKKCNNKMELISDPSIENQPKPKKKRSTRRKVVKFITILFLATTVGYLHYRYVSHLFENNRNFSYLSDMEREMSLHTEMGFYYSYYKTIVQERPFMVGVTKLMYDRLVEYPTDVNAFNRFNIHPEVIIGGVYRYLEPMLNTSAHLECYTVERGAGLAPVRSCVGLGHPILFYLEAVWVLAGLTTAAIFLHAASLSNSMLGGLFAVLQYLANHAECTRVQWTLNERENMAPFNTKSFNSMLGGLFAVLQYLANHAECTRVQWAPNERENMAAPLLALQAWLVARQLAPRDNRGLRLQMSMFIINCLCLLFWQFSQFIFLTQTAIFFVMEQLKIIDLKCLCMLLHSHFCGLHMAVLLLQGNDMLKSSLYASFFFIVSTYSLFFSSFRVKVENRLDLFVETWLVILRIAIAICGSFYLKKIMSDFLGVQEDSHIWDILYAKITNFANFHSLLYICSEVFDFLPWRSVRNLTSTLLIPLVLLAIVNICNFWLRNAIVAYRKKTSETKDGGKETEKGKRRDVQEREKKNKSEDEDSGIENVTEIVRKRKKGSLYELDKEVKLKETETTTDWLILFLQGLNIDAAIFYSISQMVVYGVMAALIMRLKMLFVPQMCVVSALVLNKTYYRTSNTFSKYIPIFWILCLIPILLRLYQNMSNELSHIGEYSDIDKEQLMEWILHETPPSAVFAGSMPILATVMLVTRRAIVAHPHYEHAQARERAYTVYKTYGRFSPDELYEELSKLKATYLIVEEKYCFGKSSKGCSFEQIWDIERPDLRRRPSLCLTLLRTRVDHLYPVFTNKEYTVFRIHDYSVRYMPRSFDT